MVSKSPSGSRPWYTGPRTKGAQTSSNRQGGGRTHHVQRPQGNKGHTRLRIKMQYFRWSSSNFELWGREESWIMLQRLANDGLGNGDDV